MKHWDLALLLTQFGLVCRIGMNACCPVVDDNCHCRPMILKAQPGLCGLRQCLPQQFLSASMRHCVDAYRCGKSFAWTRALDHSGQSCAKHAFVSRCESSHAQPAASASCHGVSRPVSGTISAGASWCSFQFRTGSFFSKALKQCVCEFWSAAAHGRACEPQLRTVFVFQSGLL